MREMAEIEIPDFTMSADEALKQALQLAADIHAGKIDESEFIDHDSLEAFETEEDVRGFFKTLVTYFDDVTTEEIDDRWETVKLAAERYGYSHYAVEDAYLEALAAVREMAVAT